MSKWKNVSISLRMVVYHHSPRQDMFFYYYRPQTKFVKVMFPQVSVCPQGAVCPIAYWDTPPRTRGRHPPGQISPRQTPPPPRQGAALDKFPPHSTSYEILSYGIKILLSFKIAFSKVPKLALLAFLCNSL